MSDAAPEPPGTAPAREPKPLATHFLVDGAVAGALMLVTALILGFRWQTVFVLAVIIGALAAPFTRRLEARQLAERATRATPVAPTSVDEPPEPGSDAPAV